jgi:hypothetical protein
VNAQWRAAVGRAAASVAFVAGVASFFYGVQGAVAWRWAWILGGIAAVAVVLPYATRRLADLLQRITSYSRVVQLLAAAEAQNEDLRHQVKEHQRDLPAAWRSGLLEGDARMKGAFRAVGHDLLPGHFDVQDGELLITTEIAPSKSSHPWDEMSVGARFSLVASGADRVIAILEAEQVSPGVVLRCTGWRDHASWARLEEHAGIGTPVPPGLTFRVAALEDYSSFADPVVPPKLIAQEDA